MDLHQVIKKPIVTERALAGQGEKPCYVFSVDLKADKGLIRAAVEQLFKVHVTDVNTSIVHGKVKKVGRSEGQRSNWKKAFVRLKVGEKIEFFEGV